jgi:cellulose synthase/poly-beta-1,6-N-acetylglucosamine synthase-like glycosyltransferase
MTEPSMLLSTLRLEGTIWISVMYIAGDRRLCMLMANHVKQDIYCTITSTYVHPEYVSVKYLRQ